MVLCLAMSAPALQAGADRLVESPTIGPRLRLSATIRANLNQYSNEAAFQLSELTLGMLDLRFDLHSQRARLNLGGGDPESFRLRIDSDVLIGQGRARIMARFDLAIAGHRWQMEIPDLDLDTESVSGERAIMLSLPLLEGKF